MLSLVLFIKIEILCYFLKFSYVSWTIVENWIINVDCHLLSVNLFNISRLLLDNLFLFYNWLLFQIVINFLWWNWFYFFRRLRLFWFFNNSRFRWSNWLKFFRLYRFFSLNGWFFLNWGRSRTILFLLSRSRLHPAK